ncbi:hypothetical protein CEP88_17265 [Roseobacter denitrificans]|nr:hypothetical protein CEP88_17265 [Roseobacter denitrificans]
MVLPMAKAKIVMAEKLCDVESTSDEVLAGCADASTQPQDVGKKNLCLHTSEVKGGMAQILCLSFCAEKRNSLRRGVFSFICRAACLVGAGAIALRAFQ